MNDTRPHQTIEPDSSVQDSYIWDEMYDTQTTSEERKELETNVRDFFSLLLSELSRQEGKEYELVRVSK